MQFLHDESVLEVTPAVTSIFSWLACSRLFSFATFAWSAEWALWLANRKKLTPMEKIAAKRMTAASTPATALRLDFARSFSAGLCKSFPPRT
jgi:hypothetical protein